MSPRCPYALGFASLNPTYGLVFRRGMIGELYASRLGKKLERRAED
ncbi:MULTISPECIES: hypothetical protein [Stutzerimonas stutzeri subgroup]|nr:MULTISPECIES: hypothetical protein [Stutzerimonas stutzeri subgroup]MCQ4291663.1 hypothetical protein [Stutzerimonas stutzeri]